MINYQFIKSKVQKHPLFKDKQENEIDHITKLVTLYILKLKYKDLHVLFNILYDSTKEEIDYFIKKFIPYNYISLGDDKIMGENELIINKLLTNIITLIYYDMKDNNIDNNIDGFLSIVKKHIREICDEKKCSFDIKKRVVKRVKLYIEGIYYNNHDIMKLIYDTISIDHIGGIMLIINNLKIIKHQIKSVSYNDFANLRLYNLILECINRENELKENENEEDEIKKYQNQIKKVRGDKIKPGLSYQQHNFVQQTRQNQQQVQPQQIKNNIVNKNIENRQVVPVQNNNSKLTNINVDKLKKETENKTNVSQNKNENIKEKTKNDEIKQIQKVQQNMIDDNSFYDDTDDEIDED